ncbi:MAG: hypothetical protein LBG77_04890 [Dysgonamonadaceae bacterium]|jgi:hypothetical protein|nr:hypothetical protein [Dysgonamonadaceae bacterium]
MRKILYFLAAFAAISFVACDENGKVEVTEDVKNGDYIGRMEVDQTDGTFYIEENQPVDFRVLDDNVHVALIFNKVKFAETMPVLDAITVDSVSSAPALNFRILGGNNIVPTSAGNPSPTFTVTDLVGSVDNDSLNVRMKMGKYPLTFRGAKASVEK